jgi:hypothetical protein
VESYKHGTKKDYENGQRVETTIDDAGEEMAEY